VTLSRRSFLAGSAAFTGITFTSNAWSNSHRPKLPIPTLIDGTNEAPVDLQLGEGLWSFKPGIMTPTFGINQDYLGPTIRARKNRELNLSYHNTLNEGVAVHGHGLHVPGEVDGGPQLEIAPGDRWSPKLSIAQPSATCWYHSHTHGKSGEQTYRGLAGLILIDDDETDAMDLPRRYGVDDIPVVIQDRTFDEQGRLVYSLMEADEDGWYGDTVVINGAIAPVAKVPAGMVRLRLLNGANARFYVVAFADNRVFHKIATDGGLLEAPVPMTTMEMSPGERCEIIVDLSDGKSADLFTLFEDEVDEAEEGIISGMLGVLGSSEVAAAMPSLTLEVDASIVPNRVPLPEKLVNIIRPKANDIVRVRAFELTMEHDGGVSGHHGHAAMDMAINGASMDMNVINERVNLGEWERWRIRSDMGAHPFHAHGCSFLIDQMEGATAPEDQRGWKDTVVLDDDDWSEIVVRFDHVATDQFPYMYHCHILEHEDRGMMGQFTVT